MDTFGRPTYTLIYHVFNIDIRRHLHWQNCDGESNHADNESFWVHVSAGRCGENLEPSTMFPKDEGSIGFTFFIETIKEGPWVHTIQMDNYLARFSLDLYPTINEANNMKWEETGYIEEIIGNEDVANNSFSGSML